MKSWLTGHFLIAVPALADPNFFRTAVLLFQHSESGAAGVVVNRRTNVKICELGEDFSSNAEGAERFVYSGGPVEGPIMAVHTSLVLAELSIGPGLYLSTDKDILLQLTQQSTQRYRFFGNYSGWSQGQLEDEIAAGGWLTTPAELDDIFETNDDRLWKSLCEQVGLSIVWPQSRQLGNQDPSCN
jgi:putative transcriptional regulator